MTTDPQATLDPFGPPLPTAEEAATTGRIGWNLRCNNCGGYGATWIPGMRPGWGALALCNPDAKALQAMQLRHSAELKALTVVNFEQDR